MIRIVFLSFFSIYLQYTYISVYKKTERGKEKRKIALTRGYWYVYFPF